MELFLNNWLTSSLQECFTTSSIAIPAKAAPTHISTTAAQPQTKVVQEATRPTTSVSSLESHTTRQTSHNIKKLQLNLTSASNKEWDNRPLTKTNMLTRY